MTYPLEPYQLPQEVITPIPTTVTVAGETYILAPRNGHPQNLPVSAAQQHSLQHQVPRTEVAHINGIEHIRTADGWRPMPGTGQTPAWIKHPYTKGLSFFAIAAVVGVGLICLAIALYAVVLAAIAHAFAIGVTAIALLAGSLLFMGQLTKVRHGHAPPRERY